MQAASPWWQRAIIYQIYPRSFQDSNDDGIGDLPGIVDRLDYLQWLGIDTIWISPIYPSPMADFGYDVADYTGIDPRFGTMEEFDRLMQATRQRGIRVLLDLVPNHSSDEHPWFVAARADRENPYRDWYIWRDPQPDGEPPNNWLSFFGGPAWSFDERTQQYYLHLFDPKQPDLNWRNPHVRTAIYDAMRFWLRKGVAGFRVDVIWMLIKDVQLRDHPANPDWREGDPPHTQLLNIYAQNQPETHTVIREMRQVIDEFDDRLLIGEIYLPIADLMDYYGPDLDECHLPFNFQLILLPEWTATAVRALVEQYEAALPTGGWPNWVLGNHDQSRIANRLGHEYVRIAQMLLLTLRGTPTLYYGDELGMSDVPIPQELVVDPAGIRTPGHSRDPERTPMPWNADNAGGFTHGRPWLPLGADYTDRNVASQQTDPHSPLALVRRLIELRRDSDALTLGDYRSVDAGHPAVFAYTRSDTQHTERWLIVLNFGDEVRKLDLRGVGERGRIDCATGMDRVGEVDLANLEIRPYEGLAIVTE
jgi:alpha-glucosidase